MGSNINFINRHEMENIETQKCLFFALEQHKIERSIKCGSKKRIWCAVMYFLCCIVSCVVV